MTTAPTDHFLSLRDVDLSLESPSGKIDILRNLNLSVGKGETVSITGPSGSGKSTMMLVTAGLQKPSAGQISINNNDITAMNEDELARFRRDHIGIVFQNFHLVPTMTALENTAIPLEFAGLRNVFEKAEDILKAVGLGHRLHHYPSQLSGGEQQRVALARAVVTNPDLLMADEPTGNLDQATGEKIMDLLFNLADEKGMTLMLITHDLSLAKRCRRSITMTDGVLSESHDDAA